MHLFRALGFWLLTTLVTGLLYPVLIWGVGRIFYPISASGGEQFFEGRRVGLHQIGQEWKDPAFFWGRPSDASTQDEWRISGSSSLSPASKKLYALVMARKRANEGQEQRVPNDQVPSDLLFSSGSGLDPHIHRDTVLYQIPRIVKARKLNRQQEEALLQLVQEFPGESMLEPASTQHIHLLSLNIALASQFGAKRGDNKDEIEGASSVWLDHRRVAPVFGYKAARVM